MRDIFIWWKLENEPLKKLYGILFYAATLISLAIGIYSGTLSIIDHYAPKDILSLLQNVLGEPLTQVSIRAESIGGRTFVLQVTKPSQNAKELAQEIAPKDGRYGMALKAIAEERYNEGRVLLEIASNEPKSKLATLYNTRGLLELYAQNYKEAFIWSTRASDLQPGNWKFLNQCTFIGLTLISQESMKPEEILPYAQNAVLLAEQMFYHQLIRL